MNVVWSRAGHGSVQGGFGLFGHRPEPSGFDNSLPAIFTKVVNPSGIRVEQGGLRGWVGQVGWLSWK
jgi:hypothetical protein